MKIGELAKQTGLTISKIRFYEAQGLIEASRQSNGYREYLPQTVNILQIIVGSQACGFSLNEIRPLLPTPDMEKWNRPELLASLKRKVEEIGVLQKQLRHNKRTLQQVIRQTENRPPDMTCSQNAEKMMKELGPPPVKPKRPSAPKVRAPSHT